MDTGVGGVGGQTSASAPNICIACVIDNLPAMRKRNNGKASVRRNSRGTAEWMQSVFQKDLQKSDKLMFDSARKKNKQKKNNKH